MGEPLLPRENEGFLDGSRYGQDDRAGRNAPHTGCKILRVGGGGNGDLPRNAVELSRGLVVGVLYALGPGHAVKVNAKTRKNGVEQIGQGNVIGRSGVNVAKVFNYKAIGQNTVFGDGERLKALGDAELRFLGGGDGLGDCDGRGNAVARYGCRVNNASVDVKRCQIVDLRGIEKNQIAVGGQGNAADRQRIFRAYGGAACRTPLINRRIEPST